MLGHSDTPDGGEHAFLSGVNGGGLVDLGTLGGTGISGNDVNDSGQVTGYSSTATGDVHAFFWGPMAGR